MIQANLFISNFKRIYKRYIKDKIKILAVVISLIILINVIANALNYLYVDAGSTQAWDKKLWNDYYDEKTNIDYLYLGSSHVYCGINPFILDELNGGNNFNLSSHGQLLNGSYYLLKEADRRHDIKHVYMDVYFMCLMGTPYSELIYLNWHNIDYMKWSFNKLNYIVDTVNSTQYLETFFPFLRYKSDYFKENAVYNKISEKRKEAEYNYQYENEIYYGKGFCARNLEMASNSLITGENTIPPSPIMEEAEEYLRKIIEYCQKKNIEITLYSTPVYTLSALSQNNYDEYVKQVSSIANEYGVKYYDFNLCKDEYMPIQEMKYYSDVSHLNPAGAELFTNFFWQVMSNSPEENEKYFFPSYAQKLQTMEPRVYGLYQTEDSGVAFYKIAANRVSEIVYQVLVEPDGGEAVTYQDFSQSPYFSRPLNEHGTMTISAWTAGQDDNVQKLEIEY